MNGREKRQQQLALYERLDSFNQHTVPSLSGSKDVHEKIDRLLIDKLIESKANVTWKPKKHKSFKLLKSVPVKKVLLSLISLALVFVVIASMLPVFYGTDDFDINIFIEPADPMEGDMIFLNATIPTHYNITNVSANISGIDTINLTLIANTTIDNLSTDQFWQGTWILHNLSAGDHFINISALDHNQTLYYKRYRWTISANISPNEPDSPELDDNDTAWDNETRDDVDENVSQDDTVDNAMLTLDLWTDHYVYTVNDTITLYGQILSNGSHVNTSVNLSLTGPTNRSSVVLNATHGTFNYSIHVEAPGDYLFTVNITVNNQSLEQTISVVVQALRSEEEVTIIDKHDEQRFVVPGTLFSVERTIVTPDDGEAIFAPLYSEGLSFEKLEIINPSDTNGKKHGTVHPLFTNDPSSPALETKANKVINTLNLKGKGLNHGIYISLSHGQGPITVRIWFKAPSFEEIDSGVAPSSGRISYLLFNTDNDAFFDFEGSTWWNSNWEYRKLLTINSSQVDADLVNFPVLVSRSSDTDLASKAQNDGDDIAFVLWNDNTTKLNHEIELFNGTSGELIAWANVTCLSSSTDTKLWMYYGNTGSSNQENVAGTWDSNYRFVLHMYDNTTTTVNDSTGNGRDGVKKDVNDPNQVTGRIGYGQNFVSASSEWINISDDFAITSSNWTVEVWASMDDTSNTQAVFQQRDNGGTGRTILEPASGTGGTWTTYLGGSANDSGHSLNSYWEYVVLVYNQSGDDCDWYFNGSYETTNNTLGAEASSGPFILGTWKDYSGGFLDAQLDEVRFSTIMRNSSWINTCYNMAVNTSTFIDYGDQEDGVKPSITFDTPPTPADDTKTTDTYAQINVTVTDLSNTSSFVDWDNSLVGYWNFEHTNSTHVFDNSTYGNNGTRKYANITGDADVADTNETQCVDYDTLQSADDVYNGWTFMATSGLASGNTTIITDYDYVNSSYRILYFQDVLTGFNETDSYALWYNTEGPNLTTGRFGSAFNFDSGDYVDCGNDASFDITDEITIEAWVKYGAMIGYPRLVSKSRISGYALRIKWDGEIQLAAEFGGVAQDNFSWSSSGFNQGDWGHVVATYNGSTIKYYINGADAGNATPFTPGPLGTNSLPLCIGAESPGTAFLFNGSIDEVRVWNRVLSWEEINASYNSSDYKLYHNFTGLSIGDYLYYAHAIDAAGNENTTETRNLEILSPEPTQSSPSPSNGSTGISTTPVLNVTVDDADNDTLTAYWYSNSSSSWALFATNNSIDTSSGSVNIIQTNNNFSNYSITYYWSVNLTDGTYWCNETYHFTTGLISTLVDAISPYETTSSPLTINATAQHNDYDNVTLWYRYSSNNSNWGNASDWWNTSWKYRKKLTADHNQVDDDLTNFPILVGITDTALANGAQDDGDDIVFTNITGTKLNHEIESFNGTTGNLVAWVNVTSLSGSSDTEIYMYFGNTTCTSQQNAAGTWDGDYVAVWHFNNSFNDSSGNNYNGTNTNMVSATGVTAGGMQNSDAEERVVNVTNWYSLTDQITAEIWLNLDNNDETFPRIFMEGPDWTDNDWGVYLRTQNDFEFRWLRVSQFEQGGNVPDDFGSGVGGVGYWWYLWGTYDEDGGGAGIDPSSMHYNNTVDGFDDVFDSGSSLPVNYNYLLIGNDAAGNSWDGRFDEVRISKVVRSNEWMNATYNTMINTTTFLTVGAEEGWMQWTDATNPDEGSPWSWNFDVPNGSGYYEFYSVGKKSGSTDESPPTSADAKCHYNLLDTTKPNISFVPPTPDDNNQTTNTYAYINVSVTDPSNTSSFIDWDNSLVGYWNFEHTSSTHVFDNSTYSNIGSIGFLSNVSSEASISDTNATQCVDNDTLYLVDDFYNGWTFEATSGAAAGNSTKIIDYDYVNSSYRILYFQDELTGFSQLDYYNLYYDASGPGPTDGKFGSAFAFDGENDYLTCPDDYSLDTSAVTVDFWVKPSNWDGNVVRKWGWGTEWTGYHIDVDADGSIRAIIAHNDSNSSSISTSINLNEWSHIVVTINNTVAKIYKNGMEKDSLDTTPLSLQMIGTAPVFIGGGSGFSGLYFNGTIDEVCIWNRVLGWEEINASYNSTVNQLYHNFTGLSIRNYSYYAHAIDAAGNENTTDTRHFEVKSNDTTKPNISFVPPTPWNNNQTTDTYVYINVSTTDTNNISSFIDWDNSLVGYWNFEHTNSTHVFDNSTHGSNGTFNGGLSTSDINAGKYGYALEFDGIDDYVDLPKDGMTAGRSEVTLEFWINADEWVGTNTIWDEYSGVYWQNSIRCDYWRTRDSSTGWGGYRNNDLALPTMSTGEWHHLVFVYSVSQNIKVIYLDGEFNTSNSTSIDPLTSDRTGAGIGYACDGDTFAGTIDEARIWNRALSWEEINASYNSKVSQLYHNFTSLNEGNHTYYAHAIDAAGNENTTETRYFEVLGDPPAIEFVPPTPDNNTVTSNTYAYINVSVNDASDTSSFIDWGDSLVGYWNFEHTNLTHVFDNSTYGNNGTFNGTNFGESNITIGKYGNALEFDGSNDYVDCGNDSSLDFGSDVDFSLDFWIKFKAYPGIYKDFIGTFAGSSTTFGYEIGFVSSDNRLRFLIKDIDGNSNSSSTTFVPSLNIWYHFVLTSDRDGDATLYANGEEACSATMASVGDIGNNVFKINNVNGDYTECLFDEVRLYNRVLSLEEINASYNSKVNQLHHNFTGLSEGNYTYYAHAIDTGGNENTTETRNLTVDTTKPNISFVPPTPWDNNQTTNTYAYINVSTTDTNNISSFIDWNQSLVGYWNFEHTNSTDVFDNSTYDNNGTFNGGLSQSDLTMGRYGNALEFDGNGNYVNCGNHGSLDMKTDDMSITAWIKLVDTTPDVHFGIVTKGAGSPTDEGYEFSYSSSGNDLHFWISDGTTRIYPDSNNNLGLNDSKWHFVAVSADRGGNATFYLDGNYVGSENISSYSGKYVNNSNRDLQIGRWISGNYFNGTIDEVCIYNRALSWEEINASFNSKVNSLYHNFTGLSVGNYSYYAHAIDAAGNENTTETRHFNKTNTPPVIIGEVPSNGSTGVLTIPTLAINVSDADNDQMNITWYSNVSYSDSVNVSIGASEDGGAHMGDNTTTYNSNYVSIWSNTNPWSNIYATGGMRFELDVPKGTTITDAYVKLYPYHTSYDDANLVIYADDVDDADNLSVNPWLYNRTRTVENVSWVANSLGVGWVNTPNISNIIQEIVNRPGWQSNNYMMLIFVPNLVSSKYLQPYDYDYGSYIPELHVNYTVSGDSWTSFGTNDSVNNGTYRQVNSNFSEPGTTYWWKVTVSDGTDTTSAIYHFTTADLSINVSPSQWNLGEVDIGDTNETTGFYFNLTSGGDVALDITINATNATNSTTGSKWNLTSPPSHDNYSLWYKKNGDSGWTNITTSFASFVTDLTVGGYQTFDLKLLMATTSSTVDPMSLTVTFKSVAS